MDLNIANLSIKLRSTPEGPLFSHDDDDSNLEPITWVVNSIVTGGISEERFTQMVDTLERGEEICTQGWSIGRPDEPSEDYTEARENWRELTNSLPGDDSYLVATSFLRRQIIVPRQVLLEIIYALKKLRQEGNFADESEEGTEQKTIQIPNNQELTNNQPHKHLDVDNISVDAFTDESEEGTEQKPSQIQNNQELTNNQPHKHLDVDNIPVDDDFLRHMEERAVALATLEQGEETLETAATASAKRRFLLVELEDAGLLNESHFVHLHQRLEQLQLPMLIAYHQAAMELHAYFRSPQRKRYLPEAVPESIFGGPISLDIL